jgi:hypothetical protein
LILIISALLRFLNWLVKSLFFFEVKDSFFILNFFKFIILINRNRPAIVTLKTELFSPECEKKIKILNSADLFKISTYK